MMAAGLSGLLLAMQSSQPSAQTNVNILPGAGAEKQALIPERIFISGHSLLADPIPADLAAIASSKGRELKWKQQYIEGSSIKRRSFGDGAAGQEWSGYKKGLGRSGKQNDILEEWHRPENHPDKPYDALLITEQHSILISLVWNETPRYLRDFHDRFIARNANGVTFFYEPWLSIDNKNDPRGWISYERAADPVWRCVVERTNVAIAADGRRDRIKFIPAALALAELVERAIQPRGLAEISRENVRATLDSLVVDDVHLTRLGKYYIALVTFAFMFGESPQGAWHPSDVTPEQAATLQDVAGTFAAQKQPAGMTLDDCRSYVRRSFLWKYLRYEVGTGWREERGFFDSVYLGMKVGVQWLRLFSTDSPENPFSNAAYRPR